MKRQLVAGFIPAKIKKMLNTKSALDAPVVVALVREIEQVTGVVCLLMDKRALKRDWPDRHQALQKSLASPLPVDMPSGRIGRAMTLARLITRDSDYAALLTRHQRPACYECIDGQYRVCLN